MYDFEITSKIEISKFVDNIYVDADIFMDRKYRKPGQLVIVVGKLSNSGNQRQKSRAKPRLRKV